MKSRVRLSLLLPILATLTACGPAASITQGAAATPKGFDLSAWDVSTTGSGPVAAEANGGVDLFLPASTRGDLQQQNLIVLRLTARCQLAADFDLQVDYALTTWPARNGVRFGLAAGPDAVERTTNPVNTDNTYATDFSGTIVQDATTNKSGRLRLARVGTTVTGYYRSNGTWVSIASATAAATSVTFAIQAWTDSNTFNRQDVRVNLKNVTATGCS